MRFLSAGDSLTFHNGEKFTTLDQDHDVYKGNCAKDRLGAFWYKNCIKTNPNGVYLWGVSSVHYAIGNVWLTWKNVSEGMKSISMKIKRVS